jgi:pectate lyase
MRRRTVMTLSIAACAALALGAVPLAAAQAGNADADADASAERGVAARATLPDGDGWASAEGGTSGGSAAEAEHVYAVSTRAELAAALAGGDDTPKIIVVEGTIDANTDDAGNPLTCEDYAADGYTREAYLEAYDPAVWGMENLPSGPLEDARLASELNQRERVVLPVGSNTTIIGDGGDARLLGATLDVRDAQNVIIRNITFEDTYDCFPQWDPTDGEFGEFYPQYDSVAVYNSHNVWVDHNTFTDGDNPDSGLPHYFGRLYAQHDGQLDIVRGADLVTVSWNVFAEHDKVMLIGNSNSAADTDRGRLRATIHHNLFHDLGQRTPRVRFGQVDVYNNHFLQDRDEDYVYSWGIGIESFLVAEHNAFTLPESIAPDRVIYRWTEGWPMTENGNRVNGEVVDLLGAYNAANPDATVGDGAGWTPELRDRVDPARAVPALVDAHAGSGQLG